MADFKEGLLGDREKETADLSATLTPDLAGGYGGVVELMRLSLLKAAQRMILVCLPKIRSVAEWRDLRFALGHAELGENVAPSLAYDADPSGLGNSKSRTRTANSWVASRNWRSVRTVGP